MIDFTDGASTAPDVAETLRTGFGIWPFEELVCALVAAAAVVAVVVFLLDVDLRIDRR